MTHVSSWESQWEGEAAINCTGEAPAGSEETEESRGAADAPCKKSVRHIWRTTASRSLQARKSHRGREAGTRKHEERERLSKEEKREKDFWKRREEELQSPGRQSYRSGWMVIKWEGAGTDESWFHRTLATWHTEALVGLKWKPEMLNSGKGV